MPLRHAAPSPRQLPGSLHRLAKEHNHTDHQISYVDTLMKTGRESTEAIVRRRRVLFAGFVARVEDTRIPKCDVRRSGGGRRLRGEE